LATLLTGKHKKKKNRVWAKGGGGQASTSNPSDGSLHERNACDRGEMPPWGRWGDKVTAKKKGFFELFKTNRARKKGLKGHRRTTCPRRFPVCEVGSQPDTRKNAKTLCFQDVYKRMNRFIEKRVQPHKVSNFIQRGKRGRQRGCGGANRLVEGRRFPKTRKGVPSVTEQTKVAKKRFCPDQCEKNNVKRQAGEKDHGFPSEKGSLLQNKQKNGQRESVVQKIKPKICRTTQGKKE